MNPLQTSVPETRLIAFYLPQFHPIPKNDTWWGKGFTEWTNVAMAKPLFPGHNQPHRPGELGFYDLRLPEARKAQADLAREYGIHGFCYYHYWFNGKRLLETPLQEILKSGEPDFPFCLCWANENWTRTWDGGENDILMEQKYSEEDDLNHIRFLCEVFRDRRYIRIHGRPLFLVYRANRLPDPLKSTTTWREVARKLGVGEIYLCRVESSPDEHTDPKELGFDAAVEFQPDGTMLSRDLRDERFPDMAAFKYEKIVDRMLSKVPPPYRRFSCVIPSWDNTPRRKRNALFFTESSPDQYGRWLRNVIDIRNDRGEEENLVFINAWNDWGEGSHLEPDERFGRAYLEATKSALDAARRDEQNRAVDAHEGILKLFVAEGKHAEAVFALERLVESFPDYSLAYNDLGVLYFEQGKADKALTAYEKAVSLNPGNMTFQKNLADFYYVVMKEYCRAISIYEKIISVKPDEVDSLLILANILTESQKFDKALFYYRKILEIDSSNPLALQLAGALEALRNKDRKEADPDHFLREARICLQNGNFSDAIDNIEALLKNHPDHAIAHNDAGFLYYKTGDKDTALVHYEKAVQLDSGNITAKKNLADFYFIELGRLEEASNLYEGILSHHPDDEEALAALGLIQARVSAC